MQFLFILILGLSAWAQTDLKPKKALFQEVCREYRREAQGFTIEAPEVGVETFFPVLGLEATQTRYSFRRFRHSLTKALEEEPGWFAHDRGRSLYGMNKKIKAVFYRGKLYVIDGHHRALISTYLGAKTIATKIVADLSHLSFEQFSEAMEKRGWAHWRNHQNQPMTPLDLCEMIDDPNFQLARLIIRRVDVKIEDGELVVNHSRGAKLSLAVKINGDIPFFENHIADALRRGGVEFNDHREEDDLGKEELKEYLEILQEKARGISSPLKKVLLLDKPTPVAKLNLEQIVLEHLQQKSCEIDLEAGKN